MTPTRVARNISTAAVASIAAWSSWSHMVHVALKFGERPEVALVLPISVDGMLIVASTAMVEDKRAARPVRWSARIAFVAGVAASVAANIAAAHPSVGARVVAAWPAVALLLVVEMLTRSQRAPVSTTAALGGAIVERTGAASTDADMDAEEPRSTSETQVATAPHTSGGSRQSRTPERQRRGAGRTSVALAAIQARRPEAGMAEIAAELGVTERHVRRLLTSTRTQKK
ncbi:DUF2637 domain-containing protein [Micromonospora sp. NPDC048905]|uniref:DUF2637 domain-containing protein n=1 Tax=Micromonospora sp. NPDC048905 TaxID=3155494 RepID=UPI00340CD1D0